FSNVNAANVLTKVRADDSAWGWNAGALFTLSPSMRLGFAYRSGIDYRLTGDRQMNLETPGTFTMSVWQRVSDRWEAMGDLSYTNWKRFDRLDLATTETYNFHNAWRFAWGAAYKATDAWKFKFGIAYERSPIRDSARHARFSDGNRLWLSLGGQWRPSAAATLDFGYAYIYQKEGQINSLQDFGGGNTANLRGSYNNSGHLLGVQYSHGF
ncbi:MAG TPA: outer membrane protein transport protein, partial [Rhodocyclaceae bacterium]|nr:outer membrane protein transport protein [Rhodocyclaceae bacterium]